MTKMWSNAACCLLLGIAIIVEGHSHHKKCTAHKPNLGDAEAVERAANRWKAKQATARSGATARCIQCISIDTYYIIFQPTQAFINNHNRQFGTDDPLNTIYRPTEQTVRDQHAVLTERFADTPFRFVMRGMEFIVNDEFYDSLIGANDSNDIRIGQQFRRGGWETLNIYFGGASDEGSFATFPQITAVGGQVAFEDGAYNHISTMPDVDPDFDSENRLGLTLVHEVGHWMGLHHTFEKDQRYTDACDPRNPGDYVDDTPQQGTASDGGCPIGADTCRGLPGRDPVTNYMDYSADDCYTTFTQGQIDRMYIIWSLFRQNSETCADTHSSFRFELIADDSAHQIMWELKSTDGETYIHTHSEGYEVNFDEVGEGQTAKHDICIEKGREFTFTIFDENGLCTGASYTLQLDGQVIRRGQAFRVQESTTFTTGPTPPPVPSLTPPTPRPTRHPTVRNLEELSPFSFPTSSTSGGGDDSGSNFGSPTADFNQGFGETSSPTCIPPPIPPPTPSPTFPSPTNAPTSGGGGFGGICFSGNTKVQVKDRGMQYMKDLKVGDHVLVDHSRYERVYSFGHRDPKQESEFVQLNNELELSKDHLVFVQERGFIPASRVVLGDAFATGQIVHTIRMVKRQGVYAPFTPSGTIVVNGILSSNYISLEEQLGSSLKAGWTSLDQRLRSLLWNHQFLCHACQMPHRIWCHWFQQTDRLSPQTKLSEWVERPYQWGRWLFRQDPIVISLLLIPVTFILGLTTTMEAVLLDLPSGAFWMRFILLLAVIMCLRRQRRKV